MQVELRDIHKAFGPVRANDGVSLTVPRASIMGILGENGAGKSTLMKILSGFILPDAGRIILDGTETVIRSPSGAIRQGIGMLHQDPLDFPPLKAVDNFILGRSGGLLPKRRRATREFRERAAELGFGLDAETYVDTLTVGERQQLEILRLLAHGARVLILDEPTTGISLPQKEKLFATLRTLAGKGMTVLFVSHKLEDVESLCSSIAVLRQGRLVGTVSPPYETRTLVGMMFGKEVSFGGRTECTAREPVLELDDVALEGRRLRMQGLGFCINGGEVVGLAGMEGSGQSLFLSACAGLVRPVAGRVRLMGREMTGRTYHQFQRRGVAYLPAARLEQGLVPGLTLSEHFVLAEGSRRLFIDRHTAGELAGERIATFNIKGSPANPVESLSGGNQQRLLLALLRRSLALVLLEHPTRGLDIESTLYVWSKLKERCARGAAIAFISSDLDELLQYSDRVLVCFAGRVSPPLAADRLSVETLGELIGGKGWERFGAREATGA
jgi:ABC-type uncharacterized transport system ATPase subunit